MRKMVYSLICWFALTLTACGASSPSTAQPTPGASAPGSTAPPELTAAPLPTGVPAATAEATAAVAESPLTAEARRQLAQQLGVDEQQLTLQSASAQEWPDSSLGCPAADQVYAQVIVPGFLLTFGDGSQTYEVHSDANGATMVLCENTRPVYLGGNTPAQPGAESSSPVLAPTAAPEDGSTEVDDMSEPMVELSKQALARELNIKPEEIAVVGVTATEWNDGSLGCPKPDMMYLQVITPGYQIVLEAQGQTYNYHTDTRSQVVRCDEGGGVGPASRQ